MKRSIFIKSVLLLLSIYMLLVSPVITALKSSASAVHITNTEHKHHIGPAYIHANPWGLISNYHFTTPHFKLNIKDLALILCCASFLLFTTSNYNTFLKKWLYKYRVLITPGNLYLRIRTLLI